MDPTASDRPPKKLLFIIGILLIIFIVGIAYAATRSDNTDTSNTSVTATPSSQSTITTQPTSDLFASWTTYTNTQGYTLKYPTTRVASPISLGDGDGGQNDPGINGTTKLFISDKNNEQRTMSVQVITCTTEQTIDSLKNSLVSANPGTNITSQGETTLGGKTGYSIEVTTALNLKLCGTESMEPLPSTQYDSPMGVVAVPVNNKVFIVTNARSNDAEGKQILSTITFN